MKLTCTQENLARGLDKVVHIAGKNVSLPILNNILLRAEKGNFFLISTNLDIGIKTKVRAKAEEDGEITVQAKLLADYINLLPASNISLLKSGDSLKVQSSGQETVVRGQESDDYPIVPEVKDVNYFDLKIDEFKESLSQVVFSASHDDIRPELSGVYFNCVSNNLTLVATDSYRLAEKTVKISNAGNEFSRIIPLRVLQEVLRMIGDGEENLKLGFTDNQVVFRFDETIVISRLIEGIYPDYKEIIPGSHKTRVVFDRIAMVKYVKTASLFSKTGINDVSLDFNSKEKKIIISAANLQIGESKAELEVDFEGENNNVVFNFKYLIDGLNIMDTAKVSLEMNSPDTPVVLRPEGKRNYLYLVMPIRR